MRAEAKLEKEREWQEKYGWIYALTAAQSTGNFGRDNHIGNAICYRFLANGLLHRIRGWGSGDDAIQSVLLELSELDAAHAASLKAIIIGFGGTLAKMGLRSNGLAQGCYWISLRPRMRSSPIMRPMRPPNMRPLTNERGCTIPRPQNGAGQRAAPKRSNQ
jgi:hypothetical protein